MAGHSPLGLFIERTEPLGFAMLQVTSRVETEACPGLAPQGSLLDCETEACPGLASWGSLLDCERRELIRIRGLLQQLERNGLMGRPTVPTGPPPCSIPEPLPLSCLCVICFMSPDLRLQRCEPSWQMVF